MRYFPLAHLCTGIFVYLALKHQESLIVQRDISASPALVAEFGQSYLDSPLQLQLDLCPIIVHLERLLCQLPLHHPSRLGIDWLIGGTEDVIAAPLPQIAHVKTTRAFFIQSLTSSSSRVRAPWKSLMAS